MKAVVCTKLGEPNLLEINEVEKPTIGKDEVCLLYTSPSPRD